MKAQFSNLDKMVIKKVNTEYSKTNEMIDTKIDTLETRFQFLENYVLKEFDFVVQE